MLCRPLVVESEHYAFSPPRSGAGRLQGRLGILRTLCVLHRLTRGPAKNTQIPGSRGNISQSAPSPRLMEDKSPPPLRSPHRRGSPASIQYSDPRAVRQGGCGVARGVRSLPQPAPWDSALSISQWPLSKALRTRLLCSRPGSRAWTQPDRGQP